MNAEYVNDDPDWSREQGTPTRRWRKVPEWGANHIRIRASRGGDELEDVVRSVPGCIEVERDARGQITAIFTRTFEAVTPAEPEQPELTLEEVLRLCDEVEETLHALGPRLEAGEVEPRRTFSVLQAAVKGIESVPRRCPHCDGWGEIVGER